MPRFNFTFQDASPLISYTNGLWTEGDPKLDPEANLYDGSFKVTNVSNARATFNFVGVAIFGALRPNHGNYSVSLDQTAGVSANGLGDTERVDLWHRYGLALESHTVEVTNQPLNSSFTYFDVDYVTIERVVGNDSDTIFHSEIDDTSDSAVSYLGTWKSDSTAETSFFNTLHSTTTSNSQVEINFHGCCIELYGLYTNAGYTVSLDNGPPVPMQGIDVDLPQNMWHPQTLLYLRDGLSERDHIVVLTATTPTQQRPFSFDYAVARSTQSFTNDTAPTVPVSTKPGHAQSSLLGIIIGVSLGGVLLLAFLIAVFLFVFRIRRQSRRPLTREELDPTAGELASNISNISPFRLPPPGSDHTSEIGGTNSVMGRSRPGVHSKQRSDSTSGMTGGSSTSRPHAYSTSPDVTQREVPRDHPQRTPLLTNTNTKGQRSPPAYDPSWQESVSDLTGRNN